MGSRPTGTVTFLFTDIEGSTRMWEEHRATMQAALERHDAILRAAIEDNGGYVFTTAGDAFSAAFTDPSSALAAAIAAQQALDGEDWGELGSLRVRMAIHTGVAHERDGDYFGPALNRAARILAVGHGGQILLSLGTEELIGGSLDGGVTLRDLGEHTLKDLGRPERLYQVVHPDLRDEFPRLQSLEAFPNNLPIQLTSFVGREMELTDVTKRLSDSRLLTLTGVGGSGKTRLSLQAAAESAEEYPHGVWLVELASIGDTELVPTAIGDVLGLTRSQGGSGNSQIGAAATSMLDQITEHLEHRTTLLVLDNCEHLITATARVVQHLLRHCPNLTVLATSREGLGVPGEMLWQVPSLDSSVGADPLESDAVRLFVERAGDANPRFRVDSEALTWISRLCERLDGMPLAIELAAARARVLDAKQIAERLDDRFRLLTGGSRTALPRHQTLEATVDWSYDLMSDNEKLVFRRLAAFRGGFTLEAAEAIAAGGDVDAFDVLDLVSQLVDKSMVVRDEVTGRFGMLETLRQYALRRLTESAEVDAVRVLHAEYFRDLAIETAPQLNGPDEAAAYATLGAEHDNFRAALAFGLENGHEEMAAHTAAPLAWYWWASSDAIEGLEWLRRVLPTEDRLDDATRAEVLAFTGMFSGFRHGSDADDLAAQAVAVAQGIDDPLREGLGHLVLGITTANRGEFDGALEHLDRALECATRAADDGLAGLAHLMSAMNHRLMSRLDEAAEHTAAAEASIRRTGRPSGLAWALTIGGQIARYRGDFEVEVAKQREARTILERIGAPDPVTFTLTNESISLTLLGRPEEAVALSRRSVAYEREGPPADRSTEILVLAAWAEHEAGNLAEALDLYDEAIDLLDPDHAWRMDVAADHLALLAADLGVARRAAFLDAWAQAASPNPEAGIYTRHFEPYRERYRTALGDDLAAVVAEGKAANVTTIPEYMRATVAELRAGLGS